MDDTGQDEALADAEVDAEADHILAELQQEEDHAAETSMELEAWRLLEAERDTMDDNATTDNTPPLDHADTTVQAAPLQPPQPESVPAHPQPESVPAHPEPPAHQVLRPRRRATRSTSMIL